MTAKRLSGHAVERIWGRHRLPEPFADLADGKSPVGELWFQDSAVRPGQLLVKYLFTSDRLSIQVHPDDRAARALGFACGKDEAWLVLEAEPGAVIGLGLKTETSARQLRAAALGGELEELIDWRPVKAGEILYSPGGTIHAIGAGLCLVEIQQDLDLTYRLYDYGRPRELHLDEAVAVATAGPYRPPNGARDLGSGRQVVTAGCAFVVEKWSGQSGMVEAPAEGPVTVIPINGEATLDGAVLDRGSVWVIEGRAELQSEPAGDLLIAYCGSHFRQEVLGSPDSVKAGCEATRVRERRA